MTEPRQPSTGDPMTEQIERERFEKYAKRRCWDVKRQHGGDLYEDEHIEMAWRGWQARAREEAELRECLSDLLELCSAEPKAGWKKWREATDQATRLLGREAAQ